MIRVRTACEMLRAELVLLERCLAAFPDGAPDVSVSERRAFEQFEKPLLTAWAACAQKLKKIARLAPLRIMAQLDDVRGRHDLLAVKLSCHAVGHRDLVEYLENEGVDARTLYNLACYWAASDEPDRAFRPLRESLEAGTVGRGAADDPAFGVLKDDPGLRARFAQVITDSEMEES